MANNLFSFSAGSLTGKEIVKQRACKKYLIHKRAYLRSEATEKSFFYRKWLSLVKLMKGDVDTDALKKKFDEEFKAVFDFDDLPYGDDEDCPF